MVCRAKADGSFLGTPSCSISGSCRPRRIARKCASAGSSASWYYGHRQHYRADRFCLRYHARGEPHDPQRFLRPLHEAQDHRRARRGRPRGRHAPRPDGGSKLPTVDLHQMQGQGADYPVSRSERTILIGRAECIADVVLKSCHALSVRQSIAPMGYMGSSKSDDRHRSWGSNAAVSLLRRHAS